MAYEIEDIRLSQQIFYYLLRYKSLSEIEERTLYRAYTEKEEVNALVKNQAKEANSQVERYSNVIYLIPNEDNNFLGFSKVELKGEFCKSGATDKDYYLSQFVILTLLVEFYDGQGRSSKAREYMKIGEFLNSIAERLSQGAERSEEVEKEGLAFQNMLEAFQALKSDEKGSRAKTTKEGLINKILLFLQKQGLIDYIEQDDMIKTTKKLDHFMDYNLLNKNNYSRVLKVLGEQADE